MDKLINLLTAFHASFFAIIFSIYFYLKQTKVHLEEKQISRKKLIYKYIDSFFKKSITKDLKYKIDIEKIDWRGLMKELIRFIIDYGKYYEGKELTTLNTNIYRKLEDKWDQLIQEETETIELENCFKDTRKKLIEKIESTQLENDPIYNCLIDFNEQDLNSLKELLNEYNDVKQQKDIKKSEQLSFIAPSFLSFISFLTSTLLYMYPEIVENARVLSELLLLISMFYFISIFIIVILGLSSSFFEKRNKLKVFIFIILPILMGFLLLPLINQDKEMSDKNNVEKIEINKGKNNIE